MYFPQCFLFKYFMIYKALLKVSHVKNVQLPREEQDERLMQVLDVQSRIMFKPTGGISQRNEFVLTFFLYFCAAISPPRKYGAILLCFGQICQQAFPLPCLAVGISQSVSPAVVPDFK